MKALASYQFKDQASLENAKAALNPNRPAAFLIAGARGSGKTRLAELILKNLARCVVARPATADAMKQAVDQAADVGFLFLDDLPERQLAAPKLLAFITSREWHFRRLHYVTLTTVANNTLTVITTSATLLPGDLTVRARVIHLVAKKARA